MNERYVPANGIIFKMKTSNKKVFSVKDMENLLREMPYITLGGDDDEHGQQRTERSRTNNTRHKDKA